MAEDHNKAAPGEQLLLLGNTTTSSPRFESPWAWRALCARKRPAKTRVPAAIREAANEVCSGNGSWPLVLLGEAGSGKTCAALLILEAMARPGWYMTFDAWCDRVRYAKCAMLQTTAGFPMSETEVWQSWADADYAVVDDIGIRKEVTDHQYEVLKRSLDKREDGQPTVYTSNLGFDDLLAVFDDRITSRLGAGTIVNVTGDQRQHEPRPPRSDDG